MPGRGHAGWGRVAGAAQVVAVLALRHVNERREARELVAQYHQSCVADLLTHVATAMDRYRDGTLTVADTDAAIHQYHRAAQEVVWKFCFSLGDVEFVAASITGLPKPVDWWERGRPRRPA